MTYEDTITGACANVHQIAAGRENDLARLTRFIGRAAEAGANLIAFPVQSGKQNNLPVQQTIKTIKRLKNWRMI
jgi:hypothetical protein